MEEPKGPPLTAADVAAGLWLLGACLLAAGRPETKPASLPEKEKP